ncbi:hypothetical protein AV530_011975 [Patagioenas fasciata monilis]|uniref:Uncharacterized protein n=1 Tax=Patagioenas fasciata monilis TaxID=372326 RepID=A0A1V4JUM6_PATFA|nr:hypothetical protein AV530_011975 [Patagioenas fasciata monilis]
MRPSGQATKPSNGAAAGNISSVLATPQSSQDGSQQQGKWTFVKRKTDGTQIERTVLSHPVQSIGISSNHVMLYVICRLKLLTR